MWSAYQQTAYVARAAEREWTIRVGQAEPALDNLLDSHGVGSWCFVTAWNPASRRLDDAQNAARNGRLETELESSPYVVLRGEGRGADSRWVPEKSLLVLGIDRPEATGLGRRHGQNAIVFGARGAPAELIDCRPSGAARV